MSSSRLLPRLIIILVCALTVASIGVCLQALRITGRPQEFRSLAKLVTGRQTLNDSSSWEKQQQDFYGTIIATVESAEMHRRALDRVRALHPELENKECAVNIRAANLKGSGTFNILATGTEPKFTRIFLNALLDEFMAFRQNIREQAQGRELQQFLQEVVTQQKGMEDSMAALEKARARVETVSAKSDQERLVARLSSLRNQRDDLRLKIKPMQESDAARAPLQTQLEAIESAIQDIESGLQRLEPDLAELRTLTEKHAVRKAAYDKLFEQVEKIQSAFNTGADYVVTQERAIPASENVEDWKLPIALGAGGGALLGGLLGFVLSLLFVRSPRPPQIPAAG